MKTQYSTLIFLLLLVSLGAGPTEQPKKTVAADGTPYPEVIFPLDIAKAMAGNPKAARKPNLPDKIQSLMLRPPWEVGRRVFSVSKSQAMLDRIMVLRDDADTTVRQGAHTETTKGTVVSHPKSDFDWFVIGLDGADVLGFDLDDGVVIGIQLCYKNATDAKIINTHPAEVPWWITWSMKKFGRSTTVRCDVHPAFLFISHLAAASTSEERNRVVELFEARYEKIRDNALNHGVAEEGKMVARIHDLDYNMSIAVALNPDPGVRLAIVDHVRTNLISIARERQTFLQQTQDSSPDGVQMRMWGGGNGAVVEIALDSENERLDALQAHFLQQAHGKNAHAAIAPKYDDRREMIRHALEKSPTELGESVSVK